MFLDVIKDEHLEFRPFLKIQSLQFYSALPFETEIQSILNKFYRLLKQTTKDKIDWIKDRLLFWNPYRAQSATYLNIILERIGGK